MIIFHKQASGLKVGYFGSPKCRLLKVDGVSLGVYINSKPKIYLLPTFTWRDHSINLRFNC